MTLLPPFEVSKVDDDFFEFLADEIEGHLIGHDEVRDICFNGVDIFGSRKGSLYLRPELPLEFQYCQQSLYSLDAQYVTLVKHHPRLKPHEFQWG